jgi:glycosyltransferase involved in cell wall biosynthesis
MTYVPFYEGFGIPILEAFNSGIPVITSDITSMPEVAAGAALLVNPHSVQSIADGMLSMVKDNKMKQELIAKGTIRKNDFSWDKSANLLWKSIESLLNT